MHVFLSRVGRRSTMQRQWETECGRARQDKANCYNNPERGLAAENAALFTEVTWYTPSSIQRWSRATTAFLRHTMHQWQLLLTSRERQSLSPYLMSLSFMYTNNACFLNTESSKIKQLLIYTVIQMTFNFMTDNTFLYQNIH